MSPLRPQYPSPKTRLQQVLTLTLTGTCVALGMWAVGDAIAHGETFQVRDVVFVGTERANSAQLRHLADVRHGTHLFNADLARAVRGVEAHPWVDEATARRRFPSAVEIHIREHQPKMLLALEELWLVDENANIFKRADSSLLDFPVLSGIDPDFLNEHPSIGRAIIDDANAIYQAVDADEQLALNELSEIHFDDQAGFTLVLRSGSRIVLGFADPAPALDRLTRMRERGLNLETPQQIDLDVGSVAIATPLH